MGEIMESIERRFEENLNKRKLKETSIDKCDVIVVLCPIVSRAGTDISAALNQLDNVKKQVILVVLHHTFEKDKTIPDSNTAVDREKTFVVDCLFNEDEGLLQCQRNEDAFEKTGKYLLEVKTSYAYFKDQAADINLLNHEGSKPDEASREGGYQGSYMCFFRCCALLFHYCAPLFRCCATLFRCCATLFRCCATLFHCCATPFRCCDTPFHCCDTPFRCCATPFRCCDTPFRCCDTPFRCCDTPFRCCATPFHCCDISFLCCATPFRCCATPFCCCATPI
ncbi:uncharacterized protein [Paramisgurnus dabryanus]|uniref:uncharacterized protein n=1 Tax=Paramisgurnus dabryanus TaxID=90735 RepID=UPI003CCF1F67